MHRLKTPFTQQSFLAKNCTNLTTLGFRNCKKITDKGLKNLIENCKKLTSLYLEGCTKITKEQIEVFKKLRPTLTIASDFGTF
ncbi:MAG: hypothetical protein HYS39_00715 [Proteobacteria bacterium]|nr:hypothetical protein [Pseudomonadota bacterium]